MRVIFVCHGNTCRSPMAEAIFKSINPDIEVVSAGISTLDGLSASVNATKVCEYNNLDIKSHKSKNFHNLTVNKDDLILALTEDICNQIRRKYPDYNVYTLKEYAGEERYLDIKDPAGGDIEIYEVCFDELKEYITMINNNRGFKG